MQAFYFLIAIIPLQRRGARRAGRGQLIFVPDVRLNTYTRIPAPSCYAIHPAMGGEPFNSPFGGSARRAREGGYSGI